MHLSLACAVAFAFDIFYTNHFVKKEDALSLTIVQFITASFIAVIAVLIQGDIPTTFEKEALYSIIYLAVFSTTIAYVCQNIAFQYTTATKGAIILSLESFFGMLLSVLFLHEVAYRANGYRRCFNYDRYFNNRIEAKLS